MPRCLAHFAVRLPAALGDREIGSCTKPNPNEPTFHFRPHHRLLEACPDQRDEARRSTRKTALDGAHGAGWRLLGASHLSSSRARRARRARPTPTAISDSQLVPPGELGKPADDANQATLSRSRLHSRHIHRQHQRDQAHQGLTTQRDSLAGRQVLSEQEEKKSCTGWMTHQVASSRSSNCPLWANRPSNDPVAVGNVRDSGPGPRNHCAGVSCRRRSMFPTGQPSCPSPYWRCPPERLVRSVVALHPGTWAPWAPWAASEGGHGGDGLGSPQPTATSEWIHTPTLPRHYCVRVCTHTQQ